MTCEGCGEAVEDCYCAAEDISPGDLAYGFHIEELPEEDEDGYREIR